MTYFQATAVGVALTLALPFTSSALAEPLLVEGKETVYQRVLTRPNAALFDQPQGALVDSYTPFEPLYVFARNGGWLEVGRSATGQPDGWIQELDGVDWHQNIVAVFTNPANRNRQIMFDTLDDLMWLMLHENVVAMQSELLAEIDAGSPRADRGIVGVEPAEHIDIRDNFYMMPILDWTEDFHPLTGEDNILLEVATIPLQTQADSNPNPEPTPDRQFEIGVVFVIDTTQSMEPYFPVMQQAIQDFVGDVAGSDIGDRISFGVVGFRDDNTGLPDLEYRVEEILPLMRRQSQEEVIQVLGGLEDADTPSPGFNEDSLEAVRFALEEMDWSAGGTPFGGRFIVLVTDAGPKLPGMPAAGNVRDFYQHVPIDIQVSAEALGTAILALHLQTPGGGAANHEYARDQYNILTLFGGESLYFPIPDGDPSAFAAETSRLVSFFGDEIARMEGQATTLTDDQTGDALLNLGLAMRLQYLGDVNETAAPDVVRSWISQQGVEDPRQRAAQFRLLVTRNELASMADLVEEFYAIGSAMQSNQDIEQFHADIREAIVRIAQNPERIIDPGAERAGDALEFLEDLPYESRLLRMSLDSWAESPGERRVILDGLNSNLQTYRRFLSTPDYWVPLYEDAPDSEWVTALPIELLP